ncbi:hypothetical protein V3C99_010906, partial [Haemonchus contortus]
MLPSAGAI